MTSPRPSPRRCSCCFQLTFAIITPALIAGAFAERMKFSAMMWFMASVVADRLRADRPLGVGRRLARRLRACSTSPAAPWCTSTPAWPAWSAPWCSASARASAPRTWRRTTCVYAVIGAALLWVGWFGFNAGSAVGASGNAGMAMAVTQFATAAAALSWMFARVGRRAASRRCSASSRAPSPAWSPSRRPRASSIRWARW